MIKYLLITVLMPIQFSVVNAQTIDLPIKEWKSNSGKPFVMYISGDGGLNNFSTGICDNINSAGYEISALNSKSYFWRKKTPEETTKDISAYLETELGETKNRQFILAGYSFGSDIIPFIVNRLPEHIRKQLTSVVLLSPSGSTDFEIHYSDMLGINPKRGMDVVAEINRMGDQYTTIISNSNGTELPVNEIKLKNHSVEIIPGGHHFEGNSVEVAHYMIKYFR